MKKNSLIAILILSLLVLGLSAFAQTLKTITLKDGSVLNGQVIRLSDGIYTIETSALGRMTVPEADIISISSTETGQSQPQASGASDPTQNKQIKSQVEAIQNDVLSDPQLMADMQDAVSDPEVQKMLSDPALLNDVMTYDPEKIQNNQTVQDLMQNPQIQDLMNKIQQKISPQPQE